MSEIQSKISLAREISTEKDAILGNLQPLERFYYATQCAKQIIFIFILFDKPSK
jgi:hypothetical protein